MMNDTMKIEVVEMMQILHDRCTQDSVEFYKEKLQIKMLLSILNVTVYVVWICIVLITILHYYSPCIKDSNRDPIIIYRNIKV